jgi:2,3,4,5-tetrahydropyridine-2-carboxylate N-succinyltransferase
MNMQHITQLKEKVEQHWQDKETINTQSKYTIECTEEVVDLLDKNEIQVCQFVENKWVVNEWIKKAILIYFKCHQNEIISSHANSAFFDKIPSKFTNWTEKDFQNAGIRVVPTSFVRKGAFIGKNSIIMPSFINIGANIGEKTMIDSFATIGSCAKIGHSCHISSQACIGGVLEPLQAKPVIIEDDCFIGAASTITEGVLVHKGSIIASGVHITASTKIYNRQTAEFVIGYVPQNSVVVMGSYASSNGFNIQCPIIIKQVTEETRKKTAINDILRDE